MANRRPARPVEEHAPGLDAPAVPTARQLASVERQLAVASHQVTQLSRPALDALLPVLAQAQRETAQGLAAWLQRVENGDLRYTAQQHRMVLLNLDRAFGTIRTLDPTMAAALERMGVQAGRLSVTHLQTEVARLSEVFEGTVRQLPIDVARVIATGQSFVIPRIRTSAARYAGQVRDDIQRELAVGIIRGESVSALVDRLVRHGGPRGLVALRGVAGEPGAVTEHIAEGLFARYRYWGERVVRTETQAAYNTHLDQGFRQARQHMPDLMRRWDASLDLRICETCAGLHGTTAPIGGTFPGGYTGAPAHPNCRCRVGAWRAEWSDILGPPAAPSSTTGAVGRSSSAPERRRRVHHEPRPDRPQPGPDVSAIITAARRRLGLTEGQSIRHDETKTRSAHVLGGAEAQRDLRRGRAAHVFLEAPNLDELELATWNRGHDAGHVRDWRRIVLEFEQAIGRRIQRGRSDVPLHVVEIKARFAESGSVEYHLVPRRRAPR